MHTTRTLLVAALLAVSAAGAMADEFERTGVQPQAASSVTRAEVRADIAKYDAANHLRAADRGENGNFAVAAVPVTTPAPKVSRAQVVALAGIYRASFKPAAREYQPGAQ